MFSTLIAIALQSTAAPTTAPAATPADAAADTKVVCRRFAETGSFVRKNKVCRTRADWRRMEEQAREDGARMQTQLSTERGG